MNNEGKPLQPEHIFKKIVWRNILSISPKIEEFLTWTITGIAGIVGLIVSNIDSVEKIASLESIKKSILCFTLSLLAGVIAKQLGIGITNGLRTMNEVEGFLFSEDGKTLIKNLNTDLKQLMEEISSPFYWPLSWVMQKSGKKGLIDYLAAEKNLICLLCLQFYFNLAHFLLAGVALVIIAR
jgi:hypothetical protein